MAAPNYSGARELCRGRSTNNPCELASVQKSISVGDRSEPGTRQQKPGFPAVLEHHPEASVPTDGDVFGMAFEARGRRYACL